MRRTYSRLSGLLVVVTTAALLAGASGCTVQLGGPGSPAPGPTGSSSASSDSSGTGTEADPGSQPGTDTNTTAPPKKKKKKQKTNVIDWALGLGVGTPSGPAFDYKAHYESLAHLKCADAVNRDNDELKVITATATACLAALGTAPDVTAAWTEATAVRDATDASQLGCIDAAAFKQLSSLVDAHQAHPDRTFKLVKGDAGRAVPGCPVMDSVDPATGHSGDVVTVHGRHLGEVDHIGIQRLDDAEPTPASVGQQSDESIEITLPDGFEGQVLLVISSPKAQWPTSVEFTYVTPDTSESPTPEETPDGSGG